MVVEGAQYVFDCDRVSTVETGRGWLICEELHMCRVCMTKA